MSEVERVAPARVFSEDDLREMVLRLAHEIRNPLATIKSGVQLVQRIAHLEGEVAEYLESVLTEVGRIDRTIRDMQRFVRITAGAPLAMDVEGAVRDALATAAAGSGGVVVAGGPRLRVRVDPANLRLALQELLDNAARHSPPGGAVMLSWDRGENGVVELHVDDEGPGIPLKLVERVSRPFFSTSTQGTGLGLNMVETVCRLASGRLDWRNLAGGGCRFSLMLPEV